jgi:ribose 5-phosphate isomerase B
MSRSHAITEADVRAAAKAGRTVEAPEGAVITPAARDLARSLGVAVVSAQGTGTAGDQRTVALGADHGGFPLKEHLKPFLAEAGYEVLDLGTSDAQPVDYPDFAIAVARAVAEGRAWRGIMIDGAGIGSAMAANKVAGVRAALCYDLTTAQNAREHNDANVLTLGGTLIGTRLAVDIARTFLAAAFGGGRHAKRVDKIKSLDTGRG